MENQDVTTVASTETTTAANTIMGNADVTTPASTETTVPTTAVEPITLPELPRDWHTTLGESAKGLDKFTSVEALARSYAHLENTLGQKANMVLPLHAESTEDEITAYRKGMGIPDSSEGYEIPLGEDADDASKAQVKAFKDFAHSNNIPPATVAKLLAFDKTRFDGMIETAETQQAEALTAATSELKQEFGTNFDHVVKSAANTVRQFGGEEMLHSPIANDPSFIKLMYGISQATGEAGFVESGEAASVFSSVDDKIGEIMSDPKSPYWDNSHPDHQRMQSKMQELFKLKSGGK